MISHNTLNNLQSLILSSIGNDATVAVACSGGVDSMFLARITSAILPNRMMAIIINHNLQEESYSTAKHTQNILLQWGIKSTILHWEHDKITVAIEERARRARYNLITSYCRDNNINKVLLAHHIDDKIETFLMNSMRGSGLRGLSSMRSKVTMYGIQFLRPMVNIVEKKDILQYMQSNNFPWFEDETNKDAKFTRNGIRKMLCLTSLQKMGIIQTIANIESEHNCNVSEVKKIINYINFSISVTDEVINFDRSKFQLIVRQSVGRIYLFRHRELRMHGIANLQKTLPRKATFAHCVFFINSKNLFIVPEYTKLHSVAAKLGQWVIWNDIVKVKCNMLCDIIPLGKVPFSIKKRYKIERKFIEIAHYPVFMQGDNILAIPELNILNIKDFIVLYENYH